MKKTPRFLDLLHAGEVDAGEIDDYIEAWHVTPSRVQLHVFLGMTWSEFRTWRRTGCLPTAEEHAQKRRDAVFSAPGEPDVLWVHPPLRCRAPCPVHWPSEHPLVEQPLVWVPTTAVLYRRCLHGVIHPDPDDQQVRLHADLAEHVCDGCCRAIVVDADFYVDDKPLADVQRAFDTAQQRGLTKGPL